MIRNAWIHILPQINSPWITLKFLILSIYLFFHQNHAWSRPDDIPAYFIYIPIFSHSNTIAHNGILNHVWNLLSVRYSSQFVEICSTIRRYNRLHWLILGTNLTQSGRTDSRYNFQTHSKLKALQNKHTEHFFLLLKCFTWNISAMFTILLTDVKVKIQRPFAKSPENQAIRQVAWNSAGICGQARKSLCHEDVPDGASGGFPTRSLRCAASGMHLAFRRITPMPHQNASKTLKISTPSPTTPRKPGGAGGMRFCGHLWQARKS